MPPTLTRRCTQRGELAAIGSMTCDGSPTAIFGWACKIPSKIHSRPNPIRSSRRQAGSARAGPGAPATAPAAAGVQVRTVTQASPTSAKMSSAISPWCTSAALNAATTAGSLMSSPEFIPGMTGPPSAARRRLQPGRVPARRPRPGRRGTPNRRSRMLLATTNAEEAAIAAPAISGLRNPAAASGIAAML